jgi:hypothetical protein
MPVKAFLDSSVDALLSVWGGERVKQDHRCLSAYWMQ